MTRKFFVWLHRWTGLATTVFLVIVGLTGTVLAFRAQLDRWINPQLFARATPGQRTLDLATLAERAEQQEPKARVGYFSIEEDQVVIACSARKDPATGKLYTLDFDHLYLSPYTGDILGRRRHGDYSHLRLNFLPLVYDLHTSLMLGSTGGWILGFVALAWTLDSFVGFYLTLPRGVKGFWRRWKLAWKVKANAGAFRLNFDLHRAGGLWFWLVLFVFAWSSVMLALIPVYERVTAALFEYEPIDAMMSFALPQPKEHPLLGWREAQSVGERLIARQAQLHGFTITRPYGLGYVAEFGVYTYDVRASNDIRGHGWDTGVWIDGDTGALRKVFLPAGQHTGNTISTWLWGLHYGDIRDFLPYRILVALFGLVLVVLSVTGVYIWWKKRGPRGLRSIAKPSAAALLVLLLMGGWSAHAESTGDTRQVHIRFAGRLGGRPFACGTRYSGISTKPVTVTPADLRFFVSEVALLDADGKATPVSLVQDGVWQYRDLALVDLEDGAGGCRNGNAAVHTEIIGTVAPGQYTGLRFTVGVPFALDHIDPASAPAPLNFTAMNWVWQAGFKFIRAEVLVVPDASTPAAGPSSAPPLPQAAPKAGSSTAGGKMASMRSSGFPVHIGSTACASSALTAPPDRECKHPNRIAVTLPHFNVTTDAVIFDMDKLLLGSDVTTNTPNTPPGCMSSENDPDCIPIFKALGLPFAGFRAANQTVFYREARQ
jgi:uncharacterized repeat protein (TIGR04052 family)